MDEVVAAVERIRREYEGFVATNFLSYPDDRDVFPANRNEFYRHKEVQEGQPTASREWVQQELSTLDKIVAPFHIPRDFAFFLSYYGGIKIKIDGYEFSIFGIGLVETGGLQSLLQDFGGEPTFKDGWQDVGDMFLRRERAEGGWNTINFRMSLSDAVRYGAIFTSGINAPYVWDAAVEDLLCVAESFSAWLDRVAAHDWAPFL